MRLRKEVISLVLAGSLVLGGVSYLPNADVTGSVASAADAQVVELPDVEFTGAFANAFNANVGGMKILEKEMTFSFTNTTAASATSNWNCPIAVLYSSDDGVLYDSTAPKANYTEYWVIRGDLYGWSGATNTASADALASANIEFSVGAGPADDAGWATWLAENKKGTAGEGSVKIENGKAVLTLTVNGATSVSKVPVPTDKDVYVALIGEQCKLTNIKFNVPSGDAQAPEESAVPSSQPAVSEEPTPTQAPDTPNDQPAPLTKLDDLDVTAFWEDGHTAGQKVTTSELFFGFKNTSKRDGQMAIQNWYGPVAVLYSSPSGELNTAAAPVADYQEHWVVRGDAYGWLNADTNSATPDNMAAANIDFVTENLPADDAGWLAWRTENGSGTRGEGSVQIVGDKIVLKLTVNGVTSVSTVPAPADKDVYLSFTGERCTLSHIKFSGNQEEARLTDEELNENSGNNDPNNGGNSSNGNSSNGNGSTSTKKKTITISKVTAKKNTKKITGTVSVKKATVKVKVGNKKFKKATVKAKKFTFKTTKLKKGTKVTIKATKTGYKAKTKKVTVK